jgi:Rod binding domain-containing protein
MSKIETVNGTQSLLDTKIEQSIKVKPHKSGDILSLEERKKAEKAARDFESLFVYLIFKEMRNAMLGKDDENDTSLDFGGDIFDDLGYLELSSQISKTGIGIGIASKIYEELTGEKLKRNWENRIEPKFQPKPTEYHKPIENKSSSVLNTSGINFVSTSSKIIERLSQFSDWIKEASAKFNLPPSLLQAVIIVESAGNPNAVSNAGAKGLMQLIDSTASYVGVKNVFNPRENIHGGAKYLREMLDMFGGNLDLALAAYNAGPGNVMKYNGIPPFRETQNYVQRVKRYVNHFTMDSQAKDKVYQ